jgi:hypothetical protein
VSVCGTTLSMAQNLFSVATEKQNMRMTKGGKEKTEPEQLERAHYVTMCERITARHMMIGASNRICCVSH